MDNFVDQLKDNINTDENPKSNKGSSANCFREILYYVSQSSFSPEVKIIGNKKCDSYGDIRFEVSMKSLGFSYDVFLKYKKDICSILISNFLGELVVRENINHFAKIITGISSEDYSTLVNKYDHRKFGVDVYRDKFIFIFHVSLLQDILLEDLKRKIK